MSGTLAIVAGAGTLPAEIAAEVAARSEDLAILRLHNIADADFSAYACRTVDLMNPKGAIAALREVGATRLVLAGTVHKPGLGLVMSGWQAVVHRDEIRRVVEGGDDNLLRGVVAYLEREGFAVIGVDEAAPRLMAPCGLIAGNAVAEAEQRDIAIGFEALRAIGPLDIGQAVVAAGRRVLAVEAAEGTNAMLMRVAGLRRKGLLGRIARRGRPVVAERVGGVLVKAPKPGQDMRVDMPVVGPRTIAAAARARLAGIAVQAGGVLVLEREKTAAAAARLGLFLVGVSP